MTKEFLPYQESLELKNLGFDERCFGFYKLLKSSLGETSYLESFSHFTKHENLELFNYKYDIPAPTFSQALRWFREKYELVGDITIFDKGFLEKGKWCYQFRIHEPIEPDNFIVNPHEYKTYEEAELDCLRELIEIVKNERP